MMQGSKTHRADSTFPDIATEIVSSTHCSRMHALLLRQRWVQDRCDFGDTSDPHCSGKCGFPKPRSPRILINTY